MSAGADGETRNWAQEIAAIAARIDVLKAWCDSECRLLQTNVNAQIAELRTDLRDLKAEVAANPDAFSLKVAAQIGELKAKGDLAYQQLQEQLAREDSQIEGQP
jgi:hypothetical protein